MISWLPKIFWLRKKTSPRISILHPGKLTAGTQQWRLGRWLFFSNWVIFRFHPIGSMYGIFPYIYHKNQPNVGKYIPYMDPMGMLMFRGITSKQFCHLESNSITMEPISDVVGGAPFSFLATTGFEQRVKRISYKNHEDKEMTRFLL